MLQARLEAYLEKKRISFPRLYFLSNDELLGILSQGNNPRAVQPHLQKLFDGIQSLEFEGEGRSLNVLAMNSAEQEQVPLSNNIKARGAVESAFSRLDDEGNANRHLLSVAQGAVPPRACATCQRPAG